MRDHIAHNPVLVYRTVVTIWVVLFVIVIWGIVAFDLKGAEREFLHNFNTLYQQASDRIHINESVLEGFAAVVGINKDLDRAQIRAYAQKMLKRYPYIFMFEIVETVDANHLETFAAHYRKTVYPHFDVKAFSYETDRQWKPLKKSAYYMPIVFMEPFPSTSRQVLGLDLGSNSFFVRALEESKRLNRSVATDPFKLVEGELGYLIHRPVPGSEIEESSSNDSHRPRDRFAVLVIRAETLLESRKPASSRMRELLYNPTFGDDDPRGYLHFSEASHSGWLEPLLFPHLTMRKAVHSDSQPFVLMVEEQLGWNIISWGKLGFALLIASFTFGVSMVYARLHLRHELERTQMTARLFYLANHDALTGLANRNLLFDRLGHAISQTERRQGQLAVLFMDLKEFKAVNDSFGHDVGDHILRQAAERLRGVVRAGDTVARLGGDEFVLVQENIQGQNDVDHLVTKIKSEFEQPFEINTGSMKLGINIGSAIYPHHGKDIDTLINLADNNMYEDKRSS